MFHAEVVEVAVAQVKGYVYPTEAEQAAAYELLIELSTRTSSAHLASTDGTIREVLNSIDEMFALTREILRRHGAEASKGSAGNLSLAVVAIRVMNEVFRPVLSRWEPMLADYEARRPLDDPNVTAIDWERRWDRGPQCRQELNQMRSSVRAYIDTLSRIAGASAIADAVLSAPKSATIPHQVVHGSLRPASIPDTVQPRTKMVRWLSPTEGWRTWRSYRPARASLKAMAQQTHRPTTGPEASFPAVEGEDFWFDYVADMGDGFDGTAPIAWLIGRHEIDLPDDRFGDVPTPPARLPRAHLLVFGGDEVYPFAEAGVYEAQTELPYAMGLEDGPDGTEPTLVAIPGNHDWLGGIEHFEQMFRSGRVFAGQWQVPQTENWWHVQLPQGWWLWGIDTGLDNELVGPQVEYFTEAAARLRPGDRVILCTPVPLWQLRQKDRASYASLRSVFDRLIVGNGATMPLALSGDSHYFAHLERLDTDFDEDHITAGGGGAFLQPTHNLPERIPLEEGNAEFRLTTRWPLPADSRAIAPGASRFFDRQYWPAIAVSMVLQLAVTGLASLTRSENTSDGLNEALRDTVWSPWLWLLLLPLVFGGVIAMRGNSHEPKLTSGARIYGLVIGAMVAATLVVVETLRWWLLPDRPVGVVVAAVVGGTAGLIVFLSGVRWANSRIKAADTMALSPACSTRFKQFLRCRIDRNGDLTVYAVGIDPVGEGWYDAMTESRSVPPYDPAGAPRIHYVWGKTYPKFRPVPLDIALSISEPDDVSTVRLTDAFVQVCEILVDRGHTLMYGGWADAGFTARLSEIEQARHADNPNAERHQINYVPDYLWPDPDPGGELSEWTRTVRVTRARGEHESDVDRVIADLTAMREHMTRRADVRILIGGALRPGQPGERLAPGIVEEAYLAARSGTPLIVAGGFGGAARLVAAVIMGRVDPAEIDELAGRFATPKPLVDGTIQASFVEMLEALGSPGVLRNGLTDGENRELLTSRDPNTVSELIQRSIRRIGSHHAH
jgi:hypothetical protein